ncbi:MAG: tRNA 2-thiouridine(34) synthase MnmA [Steroidobacteraceae bacterium]
MSGLTIVGMSGGVDSAVAAAMLCREGREVHGLFMANWEEDEAGYCTSAEDFQDARRVCQQLGIPLHRVSFASEYRDRVFEHFLAEYAAGRTPNPDVLCNREIKFGVCLEYARRLGASVFATGHYARIDRGDGRARLLRGIDTGKDQSYFLQAVSASQLDMALFPLGGLHKSEVRRYARQLGLTVHAKRDSTGVCFIGERPFREFLQGFLPAMPGPIRDLDSGAILGEHAGLMYYTVGQRSGLGLGGRRGGSGSAWYVARKDIAVNELLVVQGTEHPALFGRALQTARVDWIAGEPPGRSFEAEVQIRHRHPAVGCRVDLDAAGRASVRLEAPQRGIAPGQYAAFYQGEECLGGAVIEAATVQA